MRKPPSTWARTGGRPSGGLRSRWHTPVSSPVYLLTFTWSFDEFVIAFFLAGRDPTLPIYIWSQLRFPKKLPNVLALGACILLASGLLIVLAEWIRRRGLRPGPQADAVVVR